MIDPHAKLKAYLRLMALIVLLGAASAVITFVFIAVVKVNQPDMDTNSTHAWDRYPPIYFICLYNRWIAGRFAGEDLRGP